LFARKALKTHFTYCISGTTAHSSHGMSYTMSGAPIVRKLAVPTWGRCVDRSAGGEGGEVRGGDVGGGGGAQGGRHTSTLRQEYHIKERSCD
jgi:hypothetical protein